MSNGLEESLQKRPVKIRRSLCQYFLGILLNGIFLSSSIKMGFKHAISVRRREVLLTEIGRMMNVTGNHLLRGFI